MRHTKCIFFPQNAILAALLYSGFISSTILTISIQKSSGIPLGCKIFVFLHDNRLGFPNDMETSPKLLFSSFGGKLLVPASISESGARVENEPSH